MAENNEFPHTSETGKRYRHDEHDGRAVLVYESGTVLDAETKQLITGPLGYRLTTDRAVELNQRRQELAAERARAWVLREIQAISPDSEDIETFEDAWGAILGRLGADSFLSDATLQSRVKAAELVGKAADALPDRRMTPGSQDSGGGVDSRLLAFLGALAPVIRDVMADKITHDNVPNQDETDVLVSCPGCDEFVPDLAMCRKCGAQIQAGGEGSLDAR